MVLNFIPPESVKNIACIVQKRNKIGCKEVLIWLPQNWWKNVSPNFETLSLTELSAAGSKDLTLTYTLNAFWCVGPKGTIGCIAALIICQSIFSAILTLTGNINVSFSDHFKICLHVVIWCGLLSWPRALSVMHMLGIAIFGGKNCIVVRCLVCIWAIRLLVSQGPRNPNWASCFFRCFE